jgi:hypothetical protein
MCSLALSLPCCCCCWARLPAALPNRSQHQEDLLAAYKTALVARRGCASHTANARTANCRQPHASSTSVKLNASIDGLLFTPPPVSPPPHSARCSAKRALVSPLPVQRLFWFLCAVVFVPTRTPAMHSLAFRGLAPAPCTAVANAGWRAITAALCALVSPPAAAQLLCLVFVPSRRPASLAFRAWPCTSVLRTAVGAQSQVQVAGRHRLRHERLERGLACATEPEPRSVSTERRTHSTVQALYRA